MIYCRYPVKNSELEIGPDFEPESTALPILCDFFIDFARFRALLTNPISSPFYKPDFGLNFGPISSPFYNLDFGLDFDSISHFRGRYRARFRLNFRYYRAYFRGHFQSRFRARFRARYFYTLNTDFIIIN